MIEPIAIRDPGGGRGEVDYAQDGRVVTITINRPEAGNSLDMAHFLALKQAWILAGAPEGLRPKVPVENPCRFSGLDPDAPLTETPARCARPANREGPP